MRAKLFVIRKKDTDQYWNSSGDHGTGWNPGYPKQAYSRSGLIEQIRKLIDNDWFTDCEILELVVKKKNNIKEIAASIAKAIFECGNEYLKPTTRLQFMSGKWPNEEAQGGLNQEALRSVISTELEKIL